VLRDERDYLLRMIAAAAAALARLREKLTGGGSPAEVVQAARAAQAELLGKDAALLRALDPASAARMLGADRIPAWADLLSLEADALRADGKDGEAASAESRAQVLVSQQKKC
jgi:hypothetical protein